MLTSAAIDSHRIVPVYRPLVVPRLCALVACLYTAHVMLEMSAEPAERARQTRKRWQQLSMRRPVAHDEAPCTQRQ